METLTSDRIRQAVRNEYGQIAVTSGSGCCGSESGARAGILSQAMGYTVDEISTVPEGSNMGLGCGNPGAIASLKAGETVLDLGSGGGFDCFLAAREVGDEGRVIGVDMTPEMVSKARQNAARANYGNVEFRLGEIENLPVADSSVDVIISNCVINLSPDKSRVFAEAYRVLKPGGRVAVSDVVAFAEISTAVRQDIALNTACVSGASTVAEVKEMLEAAGFTDVRVEPKDESRSVINEWAPGSSIGDLVVSAGIEAVKSGVDC